MSTRGEKALSLPEPLSVDDRKVVLSRDDWDRIVEALTGNSETTDDPEEDAADLAAALAAGAEDAILAARLEQERSAPVEVTIPIEVLEAELDGTHPIRAWREHRKLTQWQLSSKSGVGRDLIAKIETRRKNGSIQTLSRLARALGVPLESLLEDDGEEAGTGET